MELEILDLQEMPVFTYAVPTIGVSIYSRSEVGLSYILRYQCADHNVNIIHVGSVGNAPLTLQWVLADNVKTIVQI